MSPTIALIEGGTSAATGAHIEPTKANDATSAARPDHPRRAAIAATSQLPPLHQDFEDSIADDLRAHRASPPSEGGDGNTSSGAMATEKRDEKKISSPRRIRHPN